MSAILQRQQQLQRSLLQPVQERLQLLSTKLDLVSPLKILSSGYAIVEHNNKVVRSTTSIKFNDEVDMRFSDGHATAKITGVQHE